MSYETSSLLKRITTSLTVVACVLGVFVIVLAAEQRVATDVPAADIFAAETGFAFPKDASAPASAERENRQATLHQ